ncbi:putative bifunctional diguanylate cyclase/phosphodiesterase [Lysobacter sp. 2RAF19]
MNFRVRLASFFVAALVLVQGFTAVFVYRVTRAELIGEGQRQLDVASRAFAGQLDELSNRVAASVQVLALDFALRSAIAQRDHATVVSALRNHGKRVGATRMLLVDVEGRVEADTEGKFAPGAAFPFSDLTEHALEAPASAIAAWDGRAYWVVVVPVSAPDLVGFIAAAIPVDNHLLERLQRQSALPKRIELATRGADTRWRILAQAGGDANVDVTPALAAQVPALATRPVLIDVDGRDYVAQAVSLSHSKRSAPVVAVLGYSVDAALEPYRSVGSAWAVLLGLGLLVGLMVAFLIARSVSRPVEALADAARRIADGDAAFLPPAHATRRDELGQLAGAFSHMVQTLREREARIRHQAGHDLVTGLPNRMAAETAIGGALEAHPSARAALLMIGMARLPDIINTMGHVVSDRLMADAAQRIAPIAGDGLVARATDDEFSVFLPSATRSQAVNAALRFVEALSEPYREAEFTLDLSPAVGIALSPMHGGEASTLLRRAEVALLGAMGTEEPVAVYDPSTDPHRPERLSLMSDLRKVLEGAPGAHGELELVYQPKLHLPTGRIDGAEGLLRWRHPVAGPLAPDAFIALAEETGNIRRLTRWVLGAGIEEAGRWQAAGEDLRIALNVSARDLDDVDLPRRVAGLLAAHGVSPSRVILEITESAIMGKPETAIAVLRRLAEQGIALAIDDFGVGQSSFAYLRRLPVRELKIDRTFIAHLSESREDRAIVRSIVDLGHDLGYRVTAEGVEDARTIEMLREMHCDHAQGYQVGRPLSAQAFLALVSSRTGVEA